MADSVGEFSHKHAGNAYAKGADGVIVGYSNWEGTATGFGTVFGTLSVPLGKSGASSGSCTWTGQAFLEDGSWVTGEGDGTWQQVEGQHRWKMSFPVIKISNGDRLRCEGEIDLANRTFSGRMFDAS
jgi:hypothetical protein